MGVQSWKAALVAGHRIYRIEEICMVKRNGWYWVEVEAFTEYQEAPIPFRVRIAPGGEDGPDSEYGFSVARQAARIWLEANLQRRGISHINQPILLDCSEGW